VIAVVIAGPSSFAVVSLGLLIALGVLAAHLGAHRPKAKLLIAVAVAVVIAGVAGVSAADADLMVTDACKQYEAWSVLWVLAGCYLP
jgi:hypothetical protein